MGWIYGGALTLGAVVGWAFLPSLGAYTAFFAGLGIATLTLVILLDPRSRR